MNLNSMSTGIPYQPNNPTDEERHFLARLALAQKGRPEDFEYILADMKPAPDITTLANPGEFKNVRVGIIGGGLAGLSAACELRKLGFDITVFEALDDRVGGRVYTYYFDLDKRYYGEFGPMRIPVTHETTWHYINLFKLDTRPFIQVNENAFIYLRDVRVRNDPQGRNVQNYIYPRYNLSPLERNIPWQQLTYYGFESPLLSASPRVRSEILQVKSDYSSQVLYWDFISVRKMLETKMSRQDAISLVSNFLPLAGENLYNSYIDYVQELYSVDLSFLYEIPGGTVNLPLALYKAILSKNPSAVYNGIPARYIGRVTWRGGHWVTDIHMDGDDGKPILAYKTISTDNPVYEKFDYIICAIPFSTLRTVNIQPLFSNIKMQAIKEVDYIPAQKTALFCKRRFWEEGGPGRQIIGGASYTDLPVKQIWYPSDHFHNCQKALSMVNNCFPSHSLHLLNKLTANEPGVLLVYNFSLDTTRLSNMNEKQRFEEIRKEVEMVHGLPKGYLEPIITDYKTVDWNTEPWFRGALCLYNPEQKHLFSHAAASAEYNCRVFFAGEHISAKHRWMQGALKSGMEAANNVARICSQRRSY